MFPNPDKGFVILKYIETSRFGDSLDKRFFCNSDEIKNLSSCLFKIGKYPRGITGI